MIVSKKKFLSNCLFQAIYHKILRWRKVKIKTIFYKSKYMLHLHFYWQDDEYDYDFAPCNKWIGQPLFKGVIRKHKKGTLKRLAKINKHRSKQA